MRNFNSHCVLRTKYAVPMKNFVIASMQDAKQALEYFNDFHDGFIKRIEIVSRQAVAQEGGWIGSHQFDASLKIAHYNYDDGRQPRNREVAFSFRNVCQICMDFRDLNEASWNIHALEVRDTAGMLSLVLHRDHYDSRAWIMRQHVLFQFETAGLSEELGEGTVTDFEER
jgi:hypothetical protein